MAAENAEKDIPNMPKPSLKLIKVYQHGGHQATGAVMGYCQKNEMRVRFKTVRDVETKGKAQPKFRCECFIKGKEFSVGSGPSLKAARRHAASKAFSTILEQTFSKTELDKMLKAKNKSGDPSSDVEQDQFSERRRKPLTRSQTGKSKPLIRSQTASTEVVKHKRKNSKVKNRQQARSHTSSQKNIAAKLYPSSVLEHISSQLKIIITEKQSKVWNGLKVKCGILPESRIQDEKGWGDHSDSFSFSGLPNEYLQELTDITGQHGLENDARTNVDRQAVLLGNSEPTATNSVNQQAMLPDHLEPKATNVEKNNTVEKPDENLEMEEFSYSNRQSVSLNNTGIHSEKHFWLPDDSCLLPDDSRPTKTVLLVGSNIGEEVGCNLDRETNNQQSALQETSYLYAPEPSTSITEDLSCGNTENRVSEPDLEKNIADRQTLKRRLLETEEREEREINIDVVLEKSSSYDRFHSHRGNREVVMKKLRQENSTENSVNSEEQDDNESSDIQINNAVESQDENTEEKSADSVEVQKDNLICDLDKDDTTIFTSKAQNEVVKFKCDLCLAVSADRERMLKHLEEALHYSASLVTVDAMGIPENTVRQYFLTYEPAGFKTLIPICPQGNCSLVFPHIYACATHYNFYHKSEDGALYGLAELVKDETVSSYNLYETCKVCSQTFLTSNELATHMKSENHLPYTQLDDTKTIFLCCRCYHTCHKFSMALSHCIAKKNHLSDIRVLHISVNKMKKTILPFKMSPKMDVSLMKSEIHNLKELKKHAGKSAKKRINNRIKEIRNLRNAADRPGLSFQQAGEIIRHKS